MTHNPLTAAKQRYGFEKKLMSIQEFLFELRAKLHGDSKWKDCSTTIIYSGRIASYENLTRTK